MTTPLSRIKADAEARLTEINEKLTTYDQLTAERARLITMLQTLDGWESEKPQPSISKRSRFWPKIREFLTAAGPEGAATEDIIRIICDAGVTRRDADNRLSALRSKGLVERVGNTKHRLVSFQAEEEQDDNDDQMPPNTASSPENPL